MISTSAEKRRVLALAGLVAACTTTRDPEEGASGISGAGTSSADATSNGAVSGQGSGIGTDSDPDSHGGSGTGVRLDVGSPGDGPGTLPCPADEPDCGCTAVDILFVIDNSTSMGSYQQSLAAVAPGFADAIVQSLPTGIDIHIGVTTSSFAPSGTGGTSPGEANCSPNVADRDELYDYYYTPDAMPFEENGAQGRLRDYQGQNYFQFTSGSDSQAMKEWLVGNIRDTGESGSVWEMVAAGAAYAFHPANATANAGFVRDQGAVLVIFALTDEVGNSPEEVDVYHDMIVAAKSGCGGDACIVTAGIMKPCMMTAPDNRIYPLLASFGRDPIIADIGPELDDCFDDCADGDITHCEEVNPAVTCDELLAGEGAKQYSEALGDALAQIITQTCATITPAG